MAIQFTSALVSARLQAIADAIGSGAYLSICTGGYGAVLATINLNSPPGTVSGDTLTFNGFPKTVSASGTGTAAIARIRTSGNADRIVDISVGLPGSGADIVLSTTSIIAGNNVTVDSLSMIEP